MYTNILVPVVFEHQPLIAQAIAIANKLLADGGKVTVLHVMEEIPSYVATMVSKEVLTNSLEQARTDLDDIVSKSKNAKAAVVRGHTSRTILDYSEEIEADCIVIASHKPGLEDYFLGSTAARVVRHAKCSVHVIR